jgi:hypothetical protein
MYFKLPNIFQSGDIIHITGGFHGKFQNNTAMDFKPYPLIAPIDGCTITGVGGSGSGRFFNVRIPANGDVMLQCVHGVPTRGIGQAFRKGEVMGRTVPHSGGDHWHIAIRVNGVWQGVMTYIERIYKLQLHGSPWSNPYDQWSFYADRALMALPNQFPQPVAQPADNNKPFTPPTIQADPAIEQDVKETAQAQPVEEFIEEAKNTEQELEKAKELTQLQSELIDQLVKDSQEAEAKFKDTAWNWAKFNVGNEKLGVYTATALATAGYTLAVIGENLGLFAGVLSPEQIIWTTSFISGSLIVIKGLYQIVKQFNS